MEKISKYQLGAMIILFEIGSAPLFELGIKSKQDAWLVVIVGTLIGLLFLQLYLAIQRREPDQNMGQIMVKYFGTHLGKFTLLLYVLYFTYESMRNVRDFGELTSMTLLVRTPISVVMLVFLLLSAFAVYKGMEVFFRLAEIFVLGVVLSYLFLVIASFVSGVVHLENLLPIMENGFMPLLQKNFPMIIWFPFSQTMIFLMFWGHLNEKKKTSIKSVLPYLISCTVILLMSILNLAVLGPEFTANSNIPLLQTVQLIQIAEIFERFDAFVFLLLYIGLYMKATLWYLAALLGLRQLFQTDYRKFLLPVGGIIYALSFQPANWQSHLATATIVGDRFMVDPTFYAFIPLLLYFVIRIKEFRNKRRQANNTCLK
jgi:spore germination protein KB